MRRPAAVDRYLRVRAKHPLAARPELWLGIDGRGPLTPDGIYQIVARGGRAGGRGGVPAPVPAPLQPYLAGPRRRPGRPDGAERLVLPADAHLVRRQRRGARARRNYDRIMTADPGRQAPGRSRGALAGAGDSRPRSPGVRAPVLREAGDTGVP